MRVFRTLTLVVAIVAAVAALAVVYGIPAGFLIEPLQSRFEAQTGYRLQAEDARLDFLPSPVMTTGRIIVIDPAASELRERFRAEKLRVGISLSSLMESRPRLTEIEVTDPVLRAPVTRVRSQSGGTRGIRGATGRGSGEPPLLFDRVHIRNGTIEMVSRGDRVESTIKNIEAEAVFAAAEEQLDVNVSASWDGQPVRVAVKGKASQGMFEAPSIPLEFAIELPGLLHGKLPGTAEIKVSGQQLRINTLSGTIGKNRFNGWAFVDFSDKPLVKLDLDFPRVDVEARPAAVAAPADAAADLDRPWSDRQVDLDGMNFFDAEVQISAAELLLDTFRFAPISVKATLLNGLMNANFTQVGVYNGQVRGGLAVDVSKGQPQHALRLDLDDVQAMPLLTDVIGVSALDGRMKARMDLRATGASQRAIMSSLGGYIDVLVTDGQIRNVNIAQMIRSLTARSLDGWQQKQAETTDLSQLGVLFRLENGRATTNNLRLAGPLVRVTGAGTADLGAKTLDFRLDPRLVANLQGQGSTSDPLGFGVPVVMQGTWSQPRIHLDMAGILDNPDAAYSKLRDLGEGLFGKDGGGLLKGLGSILENLGREPQKPADPKPPAQTAPQAQSGPPAQPEARKPPDSPATEGTREQSTSKPKDVETQIRDILRDLLGR